MYKDKQKTCRLFVLLGEEPALLGMPDVKTVGLLSVKYNTAKPIWKDVQINRQITQDWSSTNEDIINDMTNTVLNALIK